MIAAAHGRGSARRQAHRGRRRRLHDRAVSTNSTRPQPPCTAALDATRARTRSTTWRAEHDEYAHRDRLARANIALAKYWGKSDVALNLPAVPSISLTLEPMRTETTVTFDAALEGRRRRAQRQASPRARPTAARSRCSTRSARSPSSTSRRGSRAPTTSRPPRVSPRARPGFAALVAATWGAAGLERDNAVWSAMARQASASAARSIYGGFVELPRGIPGDAKLGAKQIAPPSHWDVRIVVAVANEGAKDVGSTEGMTLSEQTSPYYRAWVDCFGQARPPRCATASSRKTSRKWARPWSRARSPCTPA